MIISIDIIVSVKEKNMSVVSIIKVSDYEQELLNNAVLRHFEAVGIDRDLKPDMKVLIKPNLISAHKPDHAATTNPKLLLAIILALKERGVTNITIADSPGGLFTQGILKNVYSVCGLKPLSEHATLNLDTSWREVKTPEGFCVPYFNILNVIADADYIINVAKLKTHTMTTISAGIKNLFGAIPGLQKPEMHYRFPDVNDFSNMLIDLSLLIKPQITIIDAVDGMEGDGPNAGTPKRMGLTFASRDMYTQDCIASELMGIPMESVPMLKCAIERGLALPDKAQVVGDSDVPPNPFAMPKTVAFDFMARFPKFMQKPLNKFVNGVLKPLPKLEKKKCIGCGRCAESCPPQIIRIKGGKAKFKRKGCISCFCCQEMCPAKAIDIKRHISL